MAKPVRIQLRRTRGWRMPANTVVVSRPSRWGNPYKLSDYIFHGFTAKQVERKVRDHAMRDFEAALTLGLLRFTAADVRRELRGKNLACWCKPGFSCHASVLLEVANAPEARL